MPRSLKDFPDMLESRGVQVYVLKKVLSDKFKIENKESLDREILKKGDRESDSYWMKDVEKDDCEFDHGGCSSLRDFFFTLDALSDEEVGGLIGCSNDEARIHNTLLTFVRDANKKCGALQGNRNVVQYIEKVVKSVQFSPSESIQECLEMCVFPGISGPKRKAFSLAYMVKGLSLAYTGRRRCDNRDDFWNKRLKLANERESKRPYGDRNVRPTKRYLDTSITANSPQKAFSTGAWSHHGRMERISGAVEVLLASPLHATLRFPEATSTRWSHLLSSWSSTKTDTYDTTFLPNESIRSLMSRPPAKRPSVLPKNPALPQRVGLALGKLTTFQVDRLVSQLSQLRLPGQLTKHPKDLPPQCVSTIKPL
ncbi:DNA-directed RNA polymerase D subunit 2b, partial [Mucuna pruriens]